MNLTWCANILLNTTEMIVWMSLFSSVILDDVCRKQRSLVLRCSREAKSGKRRRTIAFFMTLINSYFAVCFTFKYNRFEFSRQNSIGESLGGIRDIRAQLWLAKKLGALGFELASLSSLKTFWVILKYFLWKENVQKKLSNWLLTLYWKPARNYNCRICFQRPVMLILSMLHCWAGEMSNSNCRSLWA